ncbi:hypothetical protein [Rhodococcoides fascians]|uniref:hypothetical protein n=1 Tax=Rhodococcoides fascians TaxID=1828 RepID=UPI00277DFB6A|nr:hypothetical protein [Rhodococcus fascians]MDQ0284802.1 hypothetical protein [Rhodococcus fascians]
MVVGGRDAEELADHNERQLARHNVHEVELSGWRNGIDQHLSVSIDGSSNLTYRSMCEGTLDNAAEPAMFGVIHGDHRAGERKCFSGEVGNRETCSRREYFGTAAYIDYLIVTNDRPESGSPGLVVKLRCAFPQLTEPIEPSIE